MIDVIGPRLSKLANQFPFLYFTPAQEKRILEILTELEGIFKLAEPPRSQP